MVTLAGEERLRILQRNVGAGEFERAAVRVIQRRGEIRRELALEYDPQSVGVERLARIAEGARGDIRKQESSGGGDFPNAGECRINHMIGEHGDLHVVLAHAPGNAQFLVVSALNLRRVAKQTDVWIGFAQVRRRGIESFLGARIGTGGFVIVFENCVG